MRSTTSPDVSAAAADALLLVCRAVNGAAGLLSWRCPGSACCCWCCRTKGLLLMLPLFKCGACCCACCGLPRCLASRGCSSGAAVGCSCAITEAAAAEEPCRVAAMQNSSAAALSSKLGASSNRASDSASPCCQCCGSAAQCRPGAAAPADGGWPELVPRLPPRQHWVSSASCSAAACCSCSARKAGPRLIAMATAEAEPAGSRNEGSLVTEHGQHLREARKCTGDAQWQEMRCELTGIPRVVATRRLR